MSPWRKKTDPRFVITCSDLPDPVSEQERLSTRRQIHRAFRDLNRSGGDEAARRALQEMLDEADLPTWTAEIHRHGRYQWSCIADSRDEAIQKAEEWVQGRLDEEAYLRQHAERKITYRYGSGA